MFVLSRTCRRISTALTVTAVSVTLLTAGATAAGAAQAGGQPRVDCSASNGWQCPSGAQ